MYQIKEDRITKVYTVDELDSLRVLCLSRSSPKADTVEWHKSSTTPGSKSKLVLVSKSSELKISSVNHAKDAGSYVCIATNHMVDSFGSKRRGVTRQPVRIEVRFAPIAVSNNNNNKNVENGVEKMAIDHDELSTSKQEARILCSVTANPRPVFTWFRNGIQIETNRSSTSTLTDPSTGTAAISNNNKYLTSHVTSNRLNYYEQELIINDLSPENDLYVKYACEAGNVLGSNRVRQVELVPLSRPDMPANVKAAYVDFMSVQLEWAAGFDGGLAQRFFIQLNESTLINVDAENAKQIDMLSTNNRNNSSNETETQELRVQKMSDSRAGLSDLKSHTVYTARVKAQNRLGSSDWTSPIVFETKELSQKFAQLLLPSFQTLIYNVPARQLEFTIEARPQDKNELAAASLVPVCLKVHKNEVNEINGNEKRECLPVEGNMREQTRFRVPGKIQNEMLVAVCFAQDSSICLPEYPAKVVDTPKQMSAADSLKQWLESLASSGGNNKNINNKNDLHSEFDEKSALNALDRLNANIPVSLIVSICVCIVSLLALLFIMVCYYIRKRNIRICKRLLSANSNSHAGGVVVGSGRANGGPGGSVSGLVTAGCSGSGSGTDVNCGSSSNGTTSSNDDCASSQSGSSTHGGDNKFGNEEKLRANMHAIKSEFDKKMLANQQQNQQNRAFSIDIASISAPVANNSATTLSSSLTTHQQMIATLPANNTIHHSSSNANTNTTQSSNQNLYSSSANQIGMISGTGSTNKRTFNAALTTANAKHIFEKHNQQQHQQQQQQITVTEDKDKEKEKETKLEPETEEATKITTVVAKNEENSSTTTNNQQKPYIFTEYTSLDQQLKQKTASNKKSKSTKHSLPITATSVDTSSSSSSSSSSAGSASSSGSARSSNSDPIAINNSLTSTNTNLTTSGSTSSSSSSSSTTSSTDENSKNVDSSSASASPTYGYSVSNAQQQQLQSHQQIKIDELCTSDNLLYVKSTTKPAPPTVTTTGDILSSDGSGSGESAYCHSSNSSGSGSSGKPVMLDVDQFYQHQQQQLAHQQQRLNITNNNNNNNNTKSKNVNNTNNNNKNNNNESNSAANIIRANTANYMTLIGQHQQNQQQHQQQLNHHNHQNHQNINYYGNGNGNSNSNGATTISNNVESGYSTPSRHKKVVYEVIV